MMILLMIIGWFVGGYTWNFLAGSHE